MRKYRKAVFMVAYANTSEGVEYLILKRKKHWKGWEFPKGGMEEGEKDKQTVKREIKEETGLDYKKIKKFDYEGKYNYPKEFKDRPGVIGQTFKLFAVELKKSEDRKIEIDKKEHSDYKWLKFKEAFQKLTWNNQKKSLIMVDRWLNKKPNFHIMVTSSGKIALGGKNEKNNEELINQTKENEIVLHTEKPGSPFINIKGNANIKDIKEAAIFCASKSQDWKKNKNDVIVNYFEGKDIYKEKSMKTGTFGVRNKKKIKIKKQEIQKWIENKRK